MHLLTRLPLLLLPCLVAFASCRKDEPDQPVADDDVVESIIRYDSAGASAEEHRFTYDNARRLQQVKSTALRLPDNPDAVTTYDMTYDGQGRLTEVKRQVPDARILTTRRKFYYTNGQRPDRQEYLEDTTLRRTVRYYYDQGRTLAQTTRTLADTTRDSAAFEYDAAGKLAGMNLHLQTRQTPMTFLARYNANYSADGSRLHTFGQPDFLWSFYYPQPIAQDAGIAGVMKQLALYRLLDVPVGLPLEALENLGIGAFLYRFSVLNSGPYTDPYQAQAATQGDLTTYTITQAGQPGRWEVKVRRR